MVQTLILRIDREAHGRTRDPSDRATARGQNGSTSKIGVASPALCVERGAIPDDRCDTHTNATVAPSRVAISWSWSSPIVFAHCNDSQAGAARHRDALPQTASLESTRLRQGPAVADNRKDRDHDHVHLAKRLRTLADPRASTIVGCAAPALAQDLVTAPVAARWRDMFRLEDQEVVSPELLDPEKTAPAERTVHVQVVSVSADGATLQWSTVTRRLATAGRRRT